MASSSGGGEFETPSLNVRNFVAARVAEIASLTVQLKSAQSGSQGRTKGFSFQHVSKHMRRRAVSHNPKRLPSRLRGSHLSQLQKSSGGVHKQPKRPSRKYKKRAEGNILDFNRRQLCNPAWLESHVWHAKRFHMKSMWDKKLPIAPTAKCFRSLFRAAQNRVVMQDISYLTCLEVSGPAKVLLDGLNSLLPFGYGGFNKPVSDVRQVSGHELVSHLFSPRKQVYIGPIRSLWIPGEGETTKLLIWSHPAYKSHIIEEFLTTFQLEEDVNPNPALSASFPATPSKEEKKYSWKLLMNKSWRNKSASVHLSDLNGCLNKFRLTGPKSLLVLKEIMKIGRFNSTHDGGDETETAAVTEEKQNAIWKSVNRIVDVSNNTVLPLNVVDPRLQLPDKRQAVLIPPSEGSAKNVGPCPFSRLHLSQMDSPIWDDDVRKQVLQTKVSDAKLAEIRSRNLIPGTEIDLPEELNVIPVVLVFRVGSHASERNNTFVGIDLIVPYGWLMPFWVALSYRCVRAYGMEFNQYLTFEGDPFLFDLPTCTSFAPDTLPYHTEKDKLEKDVKDKYFSYPPAKRQNLIKLGCAFPFSLDWSRFVKYTEARTCSSAELMDVDEVELEMKVKVIRRREDITAMARFLRNVKSPQAPLNSGDLFPIQITLVSGVAEERACIYLPSKQDLELFASGKYANYHILQEQLKDVNERQRSEMLRQHHKRLSLLRKKRKVARRAAASKDFDLKSRLSDLDSVGEVNNFSEKMKSLWVNEDVEDLLSSQSREPLGLVTYAHYSFLRGKVAAVGYAPVGQLKKLVMLHDQSGIQKFVNRKGNRQLYVLVRNWASSLTYHWAGLTFPEL